ncbi:MAG: two-component system response regulator RppA [Cyanobacteria bacterium P01_D01_bin.123]
MRMLLVDDEVELTDSLARLFDREGYQVDVAYGGKAALELLQRSDHTLTDIPYDLLIFDWMLPQVSGLELCERVRQAGNQTPVLLLTAKDTLDDRVMGLDAGADDYLVKPFELRELLARVRALLRRSQVRVPATKRLQVRDIELDCEAQIAYRNGKAIALSEKECRLLAYFMRHPNQLLAHERIYHHLWPGEDKPNSNVLPAQVRLLRRKLERKDEDKTPLIRAVYGKGYCLEATIPHRPPDGPSS